MCRIPKRGFRYSPSSQSKVGNATVYLRSWKHWGSLQDLFAGANPRTVRESRPTGETDSALSQGDPCMRRCERCSETLRELLKQVVKQVARLDNHKSKCIQDMMLKVPSWYAY